MNDQQQPQNGQQEEVDLRRLDNQMEDSSLDRQEATLERFLESRRNSAGPGHPTPQNPPLQSE